MSPLTAQKLNKKFSRHKEEGGGEKTKKYIILCFREQPRISKIYPTVRREIENMDHKSSLSIWPYNIYGSSMKQSIKFLLHRQNRELACILIKSTYFSALKCKYVVMQLERHTLQCTSMCP